MKVKDNFEHLAVFLIGFVVAKDAIFAYFTFVAKKSNTCVQEPSLNSFSWSKTYIIGLRLTQNRVDTEYSGHRESEAPRISLNSQFLCA